MALLVNNQAALVAQHTSFLHEMVDVRKDLLDVRREAATEFAQIRRELELIKAVLVKHETMLEQLPEAIREKIGYQK